MLRGSRGIPAEAREDQTRAFLEIQNGCDHRCTFCVIPYGRGASRSMRIEAVIARVKALTEAGKPEIVLTGVDITSYGVDLDTETRLGGLVRAILRSAPSLQRLRLSSIDAIEADADLERAFAEEERLMPHLHLSLQSGSDLILKRMKRRHAAADAVRFTDRLRRLRPDLALSGDVIAGFPTETDQDFDKSLKHIVDCGLSQVHAFPFSARPGTPAARMPQTAPAIVQERAARLRAAGQRLLSSHLDSKVGRIEPTLSERGGLARLADFTPVRLADAPPAGRLVDVEASAHDGKRLIGRVVPHMRGTAPMIAMAEAV
jgi:threonylcarbamoyladenosine tRNA methylthiotransferase MtaB